MVPVDKKRVRARASRVAEVRQPVGMQHQLVPKAVVFFNLTLTSHIH
jgi:hypothetical protein